MAHIFLYPQWFFAYSIIMQVFFAVITLIISFFSFRIYRFTEAKNLRTFGAAFFFIAIAYIVQAIVNLLILQKLDDDLSIIINLKNVFLINLFGLYLHALFYVTGLLLLLYTTLKIDNWQIFLILFAVIIITIFFSTHKLFMFYVMSTLLWLFIVLYYFMYYLTHKRMNNLLVLLGLFLLFVSTVYFTFALNKETYYVVGHIIEIVAYGLLLTNLYMISHGKKKN
jgi:hypothetical protein